MASGNQHDRATLICFIPFGLLTAIILDIQSGLLASGGFLIGGFWLSPDLDTKSKCQTRWGILQFLWWPYRKVLKHRSIFSHGPFIGTIIRLLYISVSSILLLTFLASLNIIDFSEIIKDLVNIISKNKHQFIIMILALEANVWLHLIQDGDPIPIELKKCKGKRK